MTIGERIRKERNRQAFSIETLAAMAGISRNTLYKIERNKIKDSMDSTIQAICTALGITRDDLNQTKRDKV